MADEPHTESGLWRALERHNPGVWVLRWLQKSFSLPAVLTILGVLGASGAYIISLQSRVTVLEKVVYVIPNKAELAQMQARIDGHEQRLTRLEGNWDEAVAHAGEPPLHTHARTPNRHR